MLSYHIHYELHRETNVYFILKLINQSLVLLRNDGNASSQRLPLQINSNQTFTIGGVTVVVSEPRFSITVSYRDAYELGCISEEKA